MLQPIFIFTNCLQSVFPDRLNICCVLTQEAAGEGCSMFTYIERVIIRQTNLLKSIKNRPGKILIDWYRVSQYLVHFPKIAPLKPFKINTYEF